MEIKYCCSEAQSTAYLRYGKRVIRVTHQNIYIDGIGTCVAEGTTEVPDNRTVPAIGTKRFFITQSGILKKYYVCLDCRERKKNMLGFFKTKAEALAALVTLQLCEQ